MILPLMNRIVNCYWFIILLSCVCYLKDVFSKVPTSVYLNYKGKYTSDVKNFEVVVPQRVNKDGNFISHLVSHHHSKRSVKEMEFIFYKIPIGGKDYLIELKPNRQLISPGAVIEIHKDIKKFSDRKFLNDTSNNETIGKMFRNLDIRKLENTECHFSGHVKGENISKAALSTCYGLAGFIQIKKGLYTIEPVAEHNPFNEDAYPHILYRADGLENSSVCHAVGELTVPLVDQIVRKRRECSNGLCLPMFIETLIVMDKTLVNHHRDSECENYVLTAFNMAFNLFQDASLGLLTALTIVRIIRLEDENDEMNLKVNADAEKTLRYFQTWQYEINPGDDSHPNHHDIAVLITRVNVCYSQSTCGLLGLTTTGKACDPKLSAALCEDNGLRLGYIIAHEIGHLLGADHDAENSTCNGTDANGLKTVMHPHISPAAQTWSRCSQAYFKEFLSSGKGNCLFDEPEEHHFNIQALLPGVMYNADFQCKYLISMNARECDMGSSCNSLNCYVPGYACIVTHTLPVDGTCCGENMWCHDTKCLVVGERPGAIDGNWGEWSPWSDCSRTCGSGIASATRNCDKPRPSHGGKNCVGERKRYKICAATITTVPQNISDLIRFISEEVNISFVGKPCETGRPSFRDIQCGEFNDWIYPEDGKIHKWEAYFFHDDNPCVLYCINEEKQIAALRPRVVDGTMCLRGIRDICIAGTCRTLPCDLHFGSNAVEDACGVCHGDGTECEFSEGIETFSKLEKGSSKLINVPVGARNLKVQAMSPSLAKIIVKDKDTRETYIGSNSFGMLNVPGSQAWLGLIKKYQEALHIPGPVTKPLSVWIQRLDNITVKWSMGLPTEQERKPEFVWDFLKWGPCSAKCGPGTQKSEPSCMEVKAGLVEDSFCADLEMPLAKVRQCEVVKCEPRWMVGDWKDCDQPDCQKKQRKRVVFCIKPIGEGEGESQIVPDSECEKPKPHDVEIIENRQKREDTEYNVNNNFSEPEFRFPKKHDDFHDIQKNLPNLRHFLVPHKSSKTIPLSLNNYFHSEDPGISLNSEPNKSLSNVISSNARTEYKMLSDFYEKTFSPQQTGINHIESNFRESKALKRRGKKTARADISRIQKKNSTVQFNLNLNNIYKRTKLGQNGLVRKKYLKRNSRMRKKKTRNIKFQFFRRKNKKKFNYTSSDLTNVLEKLSDNEKSRFAKLINKNNTGKLFIPEKTKSKTQQPNAFSTKNVQHKLNSFFSFFSKNNLKPKEKPEGCAYNTQHKWIKANHKEFDGSGMRKLFLADQNFNHKMLNFKKQEKSFYSNPFDPVSWTGKSALHSKNGLKDTHLGLETLFGEKRNKNCRRKRKHLKGKRTTQSGFYKKKRSNRIWKKPKSKDVISKSGREQCGGVCGADSRNYLNNLFRDNHPKIFTVKSQTSKPQEQKNNYKKPEIKEGALVVDKDSVENQEMEVIFEDDEMEGKQKKYLKLPKPPPNEKKLTLKGQDVFNLLNELQLCEDCIESKIDSRENVESNFNKEENSIEVSEKSKNFISEINSTTETSTVIEEENTSISCNSTISTEQSVTTTSTTLSEELTTTSTTLSEELTTTSTALSDLTTTSTTLPEDLTTTSTALSDLTTTSTTLFENLTTMSEPQMTTTPQSNYVSDESDYDIDEAFIENLDSSTNVIIENEELKKRKQNQSRR